MADIALFQLYVTATEASAPFKAWAAANVGGKAYTTGKPKATSELARWRAYRDAVLNGHTAVAPQLTSRFGQGLVLAARMGASG